MGRKRRTSSKPMPARGYGALIQAGAAAAALASIVGVTVTLLDLWPQGEPPPNPTLTLGVPQISDPMTYETFAKLRRFDTKSLPQKDRLIKGVKVDYQVTVTGARTGTTFPTIMTVLNSSGEVVKTMDGEPIVTTRSPDKGVLHTFIPSQGTGRYRLTVEAPEPGGSASFDLKNSRWFTFGDAR